MIKIKRRGEGKTIIACLASEKNNAGESLGNTLIG